MMAPVRIHLDTDLGSNVDDAVALALLLGAAEVELTGITTCIDPGARRAACVDELLGLAGRGEVEVVAGAEVSLTTGRTPGPPPRGGGRGGQGLVRPPDQAGSALRLLAGSVAAGATVLAIGPCTNLALLAVDRPGVLAGTHVVLMGGWFDLPADGLPESGPARDWNLQCDPVAAEVLLRHAGRLTMVPLPLTFRAHLVERHLERMARAGPLGRLLAAQARAQAGERSMAALAREHPALPPDLLAFLHDPLAGAVALGWPLVTMEERTVVPVREGDVLRVSEDPKGRAVGVAVDLDAEALEQGWLAAVEAAGPRPR